MLPSILEELKTLGDPTRVAGAERFGIRAENALGVPVPILRRIAKRLGRNQQLAEELWQTRIHDARILASMVADPQQISEATMERWVSEMRAWDVCDQCCGNTFDRTLGATERAQRWARREEEFVKRAGFATMAWMAVHVKHAPDSVFLDFLPFIEEASSDPRNYVKKAVNWALRQIGKRNALLWTASMQSAQRILQQGTPSARWIAQDAIRELQGKAQRTSLFTATEKPPRSTQKPVTKRSQRNAT